MGKKKNKKSRRDDDSTDNFNFVDNESEVRSINDIIIDEFTITIGKKQLFVDSSLSICQGKRYGLIGVNGSGKTTLMKHIAERKIKYSDTIDTLYVEQEIEPSDESVLNTVLSANTLRINLINKEHKLRERLDNDEDILDEYEKITEELIAINVDKDLSDVKKLLFGLGFSFEDQLKPTKHFSGGWRMRVSLAKALYMKPSLLLLDEPTNHLDLNACIWLTNYLSEWENTLLVISHNLDFLDTVCTNILNIEKYKICTYNGNYQNFKGLYNQKKKNEQKEWNKLEKEVKKIQKGGKKGSATKSQVQEYIKKSGLVRPEREYSVNIKFNEAPLISRPVLEVKNVEFRYDEDNLLFKNIDFGIDFESRITIVGPNGVGKSTLLNLLISNLKQTNGDISRNSKLRIGYYNQHFMDILPLDETPIDFLLSVNKKLKEFDIRRLLGMIGLESDLHKSLIRNLSGGQKARVVFCYLQADNPHILFLDEPTNHLDIETIQGLIDGINNFNGGVVIVSHDTRLITETNCELWVCKDRTVRRYEGDYDDYKDEIIREVDMLEI